MTQKTWFIADLHYKHKNILEFENRPFASVEEMEEKMIEAWNTVVGKNDVVYIVGDFCFGGYNDWIRILDQLKGNIILIKGNHDKSKIVKRVISDGYIHEYHEVGTLIREDKFLFHLTHYPLELGDRPRNFNISGHIHNQANSEACQLNVGVDSLLMAMYWNAKNLPFGTPVSLDYLVEYSTYINEKLEAQYVRGK